MSQPQITQTRTKRENEFGLQALPLFSPFRTSKIEAVAVKRKDGGEFNMYDVTVEPINHVGKKAIFRMNSTTLDRLRAVKFLAGDSAPVDATYSPEQKTVLFSAQLS